MSITPIALFASACGMGLRREALVEGSLHFTYHQMAMAVELATADLRTKGVGPGDRVAHLGKLSAVHSILLFACARLGAIYVPLDAWAPWPAIETMLGLMDPRALVLGESAMGRSLAGQLSRGGDVRPGRMVPIDTLSSEWSRPVDAPGTGFRNVTAAFQSAEVPHLVLFTSGSTGQPKPLVYTQAAVAGQGLLIALALHIGPTDRFLNVYPAGHFGSVMAAMQMVAVGGCVIQVPLPEPNRVFHTIGAERPTYMVATPHLWRSLFKDRSAGEMDWSCLRIANVASDTITQELLEQVMETTGAVSIQGYGLTEAGLVTLLPHAEARTRIGSAGLPLPLCEVRIVWNEGDIAAEGEVGEIHVRSAFGASGVWRSGQIVPLDRTEDGFLATGDLGYLRDGYLTVTGRTGTMLKVSGFRISVAEIERVLLTHPSVHDCAVIGTSHPVLGEAPIAVLVTADGADVLAEELHSWVVRHLLPRAAPVAFHQAQFIPRTEGSGKIRRKQVAAEWESGSYPILR